MKIEVSRAIVISLSVEETQKLFDELTDIDTDNTPQTYKVWDELNSIQDQFTKE